MKAPTFLFPLVLLAAAAAGCQDSEAPRQTLGAPAVPQSGGGGGLPPEVQVHVDSGNLTYRAGDYEAALRHYREGARVGPDQAVPWFGVAMAAQKVGNQALADSARAKVQELSPQSAGDVHHPGTGAPDSAAAAPPAKAPGAE